MEEKLKYRLVGAAVILALMAFFLPLILDSKKYKTEIVSQIPPMPEAQSESEQATAIENQGTLVIELDKTLEANTQKSIDKEEKKPLAADVEVVTEKPPSTDEVEGAKAVIPKPEANKEIVSITEPENQASVNDKPKENEPKAVSSNPKLAQETKPLSVLKTHPEVKAPDFKEAAYLVQIGSFSNKDNASKLVSDLRKQDYRAYQRVSADFSRVFVGPYPDKAIADSRSAALSKIVGNSVKIIEFDPIKH